ncbi:MAG: Rha family transcriptional regulator [Desulfovibrionaceae bacterium]|nr:Rha family transcriptional regulator [Desulfovibrionaceae bacterium]
MTNFIPSPSVSIVNGRPSVTSLKIAEHFNKNHQHVVRDLRRISGEVPEDFRLSNFGQSSYVNEQGKDQPMFILYRDGFMLLVMSYTGKKALQIKLAYIAAFNAMEAELARKEQKQLPETTTPSTPADRKPLRSLVNAWAQTANVHHSTLWPQVRAYFQLERIDDLPVEWIPDALAFVQGKIDGLQKVLPNPKQPTLMESNVVLALTPKWYQIQLESLWNTYNERSHEFYAWMKAVDASRHIHEKARW